MQSINKGEYSRIAKPNSAHNTAFDKHCSVPRVLFHLHYIITFPSETMLPILVLSLLALNGVSAFQTDVDHNSEMTETVRAESGYSIDDFNDLVDEVLGACDSNGCDVGTEKCNIAHCIKVDGDNLDDNTENILEIVGKYIKASMTTEETTITSCGGMGFCDTLPAVNYSIPGYVSLRRNYDDGGPNALYKVSISTEDGKDACGTVFDALSVATSGLDAPDLFGAMKIVACQ